MGISGINPSQLTPLPQASPLPTVGPGSPAKDVQGVQDQLKQLGYKIESKEDKADTYGASTTAAVSKFQKDVHLPVTGVVDEKTQLVMANLLQTLKQAEMEKNRLLRDLQKAKSSFGP